MPLVSDSLRAAKTLSLNGLHISKPDAIECVVSLYYFGALVRHVIVAEIPQASEDLAS